MTTPLATNQPLQGFQVVDSTPDSNRTFPAGALTPAVMRASQGSATVRIAGPAGNATVTLPVPATAIRDIQSFTTATGVASTGGSKKQYLTQTTDYTFVGSNASGVAALTEVNGTDYSAETWVVTYSPLEVDATIGGQSSAKH